MVHDELVQIGNEACQPLLRREVLFVAGMLLERRPLDMGAATIHPKHCAFNDRNLNLLRAGTGNKNEDNNRRDAAVFALGT